MARVVSKRTKLINTAIVACRIRPRRTRSERLWRCCSHLAGPWTATRRFRRVRTISSIFPIAALRVGMRMKISELQKKLDTTLVYVTHDQVEAMTMADKIVVLTSSVIEQVGSPLELYKTPRNKFGADGLRIS